MRSGRNSSSGIVSTTAEHKSRLLDTARLMQLDSMLPSTIAPGQLRGASGSGVLITGATGFLGRYLLRELLGRDRPIVYCLVRARDDAAACSRLLAALRSTGAVLTALPAGVRVLAGDTSLPRFGLQDADYRLLTKQVGAIYHCAAEVNWARSYRQLRRANVLPAVEVVRLASIGPLKRIYFVSTIGVCFAAGAPGRIDETTDMMPHAVDMPLGYAQSKCVAERLLHTAASRGVPVSIIRPGLISGDSDSGFCNDRDILCALLERCVNSGTAFDIDWLMDCVPVNFVARVLATLADYPRPDWEVLHLIHDQGRHWREVVLWMNLYGYPIRLEPESAWITANFRRAGIRDRLSAYRRFFQGLPGKADAQAPYRSYLAPAQERIDSRATLHVLDELRLTTPPLDSALLHSYFTHYASAGLVPRSRRTAVRSLARDEHVDLLEATLRNRFERRGIELIAFEPRPFRASNSILNEISSIRLGSRVGLRCCDVIVRERDSRLTRRLPILFKSKASDGLIEDLMTEIAHLCDRELGHYCDEFKGNLGFARCHERELALYELDEPRLRRHTPACHGTLRDLENGVWSIALEYVATTPQTDVDLAYGGWSQPQIAAAIRGMSQIHAIWYRQETRISALHWLAPEMTVDRAVQMTPFWRRLATFADRHFSSWLDRSLSPIQFELIESLADWWPRLNAQPRTLIHNDFNPRNLVLRESEGGYALCAFDWELATIGPPQHDLAELLCFVSHEETGRADLERRVDGHRRALELATGLPVDRDAWREGFLLSLQDLLINRLSMYTVIHRFKRQPYLPRVIRNWLRLYEIARQVG